MHVADAKNRKDLGPVFWLGFPLGSLALYLLAPLLGYDRWQKLMAGERGFVELATVAVLLPAVVLGVMLFARRRKLPRHVGWGMLLVALAALYFAGEEASWGQHVLGFATPRRWAQINSQRECNLHNLALARHGRLGRLAGHLLGHIPRQAMLLGVLVMGVVVPLGRVVSSRLWRAGKTRQEWSVWHWLIPSWRLVPASLLAAGSTLPRKMLRLTVGIDSVGRYTYPFMAFVDRAGEFKEYCFAMVILLYMVSAWVRLRPLAERDPTVSAEVLGHDETIGTHGEGVGDQRLEGMAAGSTCSTLPIRRHRS